MSYGIEIYNSNGNIVIDSNYPCLQLFNGQVLNGTYDNSFGFYRYNVYKGNLIFFNLNVGQWVGIDGNGVMCSNFPTLKIREVLLEGSLDVDPLYSYGIQVYDSNGNVTYSGGSEVEVIKDVIKIPGGYAVTSGAYNTSLPEHPNYTYYTDKEWYAICSFPISGYGNKLLCGTVYRKTSYYIQGILYGLNPTGNITYINPEPFWLLTAE